MSTAQIDLNKKAGLLEGDDGQLRLAAWFHYIYAGLIFLASLFFLVLFIFSGTAMLFSAAQGPSGWYATFGWLYLGIGLAGLLIVAVLCTLHIYAGLNLQRRKQYKFCVVVSALCCVNVPIGLAVGVFTLTALARDSVRGQFHRASIPG